MKRVIFIAFGCGIGSGLRFLIDAMTSAFAVGAFPVGTLLVNLVGSFLIGLLIGKLGVNPSEDGSDCRYFWITGFCGGFTTFSAFSWQTLELMKSGDAILAAAYAAGSIFGGIVAVGLGLLLSRKGRRLET